MLLEDRLVLAEGEPAGGRVEGGAGAADVDHQVVVGEGVALGGGVGGAADRHLHVALPGLAVHVLEDDLPLGGGAAARHRGGAGPGAGGGAGRGHGRGHRRGGGGGGRPPA